MTEPAFHHPVASLWQQCLNAVEPPPVREQRDIPRGALVRARWDWERDGEEWLDGRVMSVWERRGYEDVVLVHRLHRNARGQTRRVAVDARRRTVQVACVSRASTTCETLCHVAPPAVSPYRPITSVSALPRVKRQMRPPTPYRARTATHSTWCVIGNRSKARRLSSS